MRVKLSIPLSGGEVFREWAIVDNIELNLISLRLSRAILPEHVAISIGSIIEVRIFANNISYCCRGIVINEYNGEFLNMELISEIITNELREFFRIDVFLPVHITRPTEQDEERLKDEWIQRRRQMVNPYENEEVDPTRIENEWAQLLPIPVNMSGGGMRCKVPTPTAKGDLLWVKIHVPLSPQRDVLLVGKAVYASTVTENNETLHDTAMHFLLIDERDRDALINYISDMELRRIREFKKHYLQHSLANEDKEKRPLWERFLIKTFYAAICSFALIYLINALINYKNNRSKHEIEKTFENSIQEYADKVNKNKE